VIGVGRHDGRRRAGVGEQFHWTAWMVSGRQRVSVSPSGPQSRCVRRGGGWQQTGVLRVPSRNAAAAVLTSDY